MNCLLYRQVPEEMPRSGSRCRRAAIAGGQGQRRVDVYLRLEHRLPIPQPGKLGEFLEDLDQDEDQRRLLDLALWRQLRTRPLDGMNDSTH